jgi:hypothetical protein
MDAISTAGPDTPAYALVRPGSFEPARHFYPRVLNAQIHSMVRFFLALDHERIVRRYVHLHPGVQPATLRRLLASEPRHFRWAGSDLFHVTTPDAVRQMVVIETNSCPSGQKSMPLYDEHEEQGGYRQNLERALLPILPRADLPSGDLAVVYDKNEMEASGYAAALADLAGEPVHLVGMRDGAGPTRARFDDGLLRVCAEDGAWRPIRAAFRYVTQRPWTRIPIRTRTAVVNPVIACLAGGRNKLVAAKAYDLLNAHLAGTGLSIRRPETIWDVGWAEIPLWVERLGGRAVVKVPYANAGQGVYTIASPTELARFRAQGPRHYERYIVQSLVGNLRWSSTGSEGRFFHVGTVPDRRGESFVADVRMMVGAGPDGFRALAVYARRARQPLTDEIGEGAASWDMLGTNLSARRPDGSWASETERLLLMDRKDFNTLGLALDDLIEAYVQTVLATTAIDHMATRLLDEEGRLKAALFRSLDDDSVLLAELMDPLS